VTAVLQLLYYVSLVGAWDAAAGEQSQLSGSKLLPPARNLWEIFISEIPV